ncbi:carboxylesterase/lipase family protein [Streptomyces zagrosensis]|uniref:Carboxylic ester hydrolase n=1 Tax=Streptomyces zagrosensis TaxID=1042984 RepID=A0A7W9V2S0_9ACTN|nr:carboxylesterase family protein [Streptomyces zagrosensis]MBB5939149.1 para-nitrobenzyl esterase [Streptomyces zagrosensis]
MPHHQEPVIELSDGRLRGRSEGDVHRFLNIPYAAPPLGAGRFAHPAPAVPWTGVRDAGEPGPTAPQPRRDAFGSLDMSPYFGPGWIRGDEDGGDGDGGGYLTVNVWTPAPTSTPTPASAASGLAPSVDGRGLPVMVFVHGGGFVAGSGRAPLYDGGSFARSGVILVTLNYRLGIAGFLDLPGAPPNRGLLDVVAALGWVRRNIEAFGGDPGNVTVFGQSAGATLVGALLATVEAAGLFHRAIVQSGNGLGAHTLEQAARVTRAAADLLGVAPTATAFADLPDDRLVAAIPRLAGLDLRTATARDPLLGLSPFSVALAQQPADAVAAGAGADIALMVGTTSEEGNLYLVPQGHLTATTAADVTAIATLAACDPAGHISAYRARMPHAGDGELRAAILSDALFGAGSRRLADAHAAHGRAATYTYEFGWRSPALEGALGAAHAVELPFVFHRTGLRELRGPNALLGAAEPPAALAARVHAAWIGFARDGDPGWDRYTPRRPWTPLIGGLAAARSAGRLALWPRAE